MEKIFDSKVALVTGAASGIGKSSALAFAARGATVIVADVNDGTETVHSITANGGSAVFISCDISSEKQVKSMIDKIISDFGRLDYAFNNAGIEGTSALIHEYSGEDWDKIMNINLKGTWHCMKYEIPVMLKQGTGAIVNCASIAGLVGFQQASIYTASKHGINGLTKSAALECAAKGVRINAICPGVIDTPMVDRAVKNDKESKKMYADLEPMHRLGDASEIAQAAVWLCSDASSFVTGHLLAVDGGWVAQ